MLHRTILEDNRRFPLLTVEEMSLIKIMTMLCDHLQLRRLILKCKFDVSVQSSSKLHLRSGKEWKAVETKANELVSQVHLPDLLRKKILVYLWPVCYRMILWKSIYAPCIKNSFLNDFHWTDQGRINNTRTIKCLIRNRNLLVRERFALACSVCLEREIGEIWKEMSIDDKAFLCVEYYEKTNPLVRFWLHTLVGSYYADEPRLDNALVYATRVGLLEAVKYLFAVAPKDEIVYMTTSCSDLLVEKLRSGNLLEEDENDMQYFVFSLMSDKQQRLTFQYFTETALSLLLHSSKYELCFQLMVERLKTASMEEIARALRIIFYSYHLEINSAEDCRILFMDIWRKIPVWMKRDKTLGYVSAEILFVLIRDNFPFLFDFEFNGSDKPHKFCQGKWNLLYFIIKEGITISFLKKRRKKILSCLKRSVFYEGTFNYVLELVRNVQRNEIMPIR